MLISSLFTSLSTIMITFNYDKLSLTFPELTAKEDDDHDQNKWCNDEYANNSTQCSTQQLHSDHKITVYRVTT